MQTGSPIESIAASLHAACLRDLPEIVYMDRDWPKYRAYLNSLSHEDRATAYAEEQRTGVAIGPMIERRRRPDPTECAVLMFPQTWGSTALGFGGVGGQAITTAYTVIVTSDHDGFRAVYFAGRLAYLIAPGTSEHALRVAITRQKMPSVARAAALGWTASPPTESAVHGRAAPGDTP